MTVRVAFGRRGNWSGAALGAIAFVSLAAAPWWGGRDDLQLLAEIYAYVALASLWNLLAGFSGLVSVGQQAYVGLGAYTLFALAIVFGCRHYGRSRWPASPPPACRFRWRF